ncbi:MAG: hypothetical protein KJ749_10915, partial [Planctomycetes bacterium]|nr:hypothetical protein [Planctomycetota bacterium]
MILAGPASYLGFVVATVYTLVAWFRRTQSREAFFEFVAQRMLSSSESAADIERVVLPSQRAICQSFCRSIAKHLAPFHRKVEQRGEGRKLVVGEIRHTLYGDSLVPSRSHDQRSGHWESAPEKGWAPVASVAIELVDEGSVAKPEPFLAKLGLLAVRSPSGNWYIVIPDHKTVSACVRPFEYQVQKRYARAKHELFSVESIRKAMEQRETAQKPSHRSAGENRQADSNTRSAEIAKLLEQLPVKDKTPLLTKLKARSGGNVFNELT